MPASVPPLSLQVRRHPDHTLVRFLDCDSLGEHNVEALGQQIIPLVEERPCAQLRLDLSEVRYITSVGLGKFVALNRMLRASGGCLVLCNPSPMVVEALAITRLDQLLEVLPPVSDLSA